MCIRRFGWILAHVARNQSVRVLTNAVDSSDSAEKKPSRSVRLDFWRGRWNAQTNRSLGWRAGVDLAFRIARRSGNEDLIRGNASTGKIGFSHGFCCGRNIPYIPQEQLLWHPTRLTATGYPLAGVGARDRSLAPRSPPEVAEKASIVCQISRNAPWLACRCGTIV